MSADNLKNLSLEGRARLVGDLVNRIEYAGDPDKRRRDVEAAVLEHLRIVAAQTNTGGHYSVG